MKLLFIGQAPSKETDGLPPFVGKCGKFLAELLQTSQDQMLLDHDFRNIFDRWPGKGIGGDKFPMSEAQILAKRMLPSLRGRMVILLGSNVARAFGAKFQYYGLYEMRDPQNVEDIIVPLMVVVPHPSGVNRHWNNYANREIASKFLCNLAEKAKSFPGPGEKHHDNIDSVRK